MTIRERSWWGWGWADAALSDAECAQLAALVPGRPGSPAPESPLPESPLPESPLPESPLPESPLPVPDVGPLPRPRIAVPPSLAGICSTAPPDRASHTHGKAYRDVVRNLRGDLRHAPDVVAYPRHERDVVDLLDWAGTANVAVVPYGGGSSVVGGVEYRGGEHNGVVSLDLRHLDEVIEVDETSRAARIQAGVFGPALERKLRPHGMTLRHFPQSFEFSTLGGWLATRSAGHYATLHTHLDDFVESLRVVTPVGVSQSWRLPASGAGPSHDRLFLGSEGTLGVITEAWLRTQDRPIHRASTAVRFADFGRAVDAVRTIAQSGLYPANCRLLDPGEAMLSGAAGDGSSVLVLGFESAHQPVDGLLASTTELAREHGGALAGPAGGTGAGDAGAGDAGAGGTGAGDAIESWRSAFLRMPYLRDGLARMSVVVETFETACTWDRVAALIERVRPELAAAVSETCGAAGMINCRLTHVYPDGAAPYFTVIAPGRRGDELAQWDDLKAAAGEILCDEQATITHHHAVGRDHRPWYDRQRAEPFAAVLRAAKRTLDPHGVLNPGVLIG